ncbi:putative protein kinase CAMK-CDPK family [Helianthus anomalus]
MSRSYAVSNLCGFVHSLLLLKGASERGAKRIRVHVLTDGRDVVDGSSVGFAETLEKDLAELHGKGIDAQVASGGGRMYVTMDRYEDIEVLAVNSSALGNSKVMEKLFKRYMEPVGTSVCSVFGWRSSAYSEGSDFYQIYPYYVAPEVLLKHYGPEADVWTAGVILYILHSGVPLFWAETQHGIFDAVLKGYIDFESDPWRLISNSAKDLIRKIALDPAILSHLKQFSAMNKLKKMALRVIAESLSDV